MELPVLPKSIRMSKPISTRQMHFCLQTTGCVTVKAKTLKDAYLLSESVESIARTLLYAHLLGGEYPLTQPELNQLYEMRKKKSGKRSSYPLR